MAALALDGCALTFQEHLPDMACSTSMALPVADLAIVGSEVLTAGIGQVMHDGILFKRREDAGTIIAGTALFAAVIQGASAGNGMRRAGACRRVSRAPITTR
jgi:hypothetical protein